MATSSVPALNDRKSACDRYDEGMADGFCRDGAQSGFRPFTSLTSDITYDVISYNFLWRRKIGDHQPRERRELASGGISR
jgi:hypothetical protein